jgi:Spy/CpxP family protein refolding chaperone
MIHLKLEETMKTKVGIFCGVLLLAAGAVSAQAFPPMPAPAPMPASAAPMPLPAPAAAPMPIEGQQPMPAPPVPAAIPMDGQQPKWAPQPPSPVPGQQPMPAPPAPAAPPNAPDPIARNLFPPDFIMAHIEDIGLTPDQRKALKEEIRDAQKQFTEMQWQLEDAVEAMGDLLKPTTVDEKAAQAQLEKVLGLERQIKSAQLGLMIRLKNKLNANQQYQLTYFERYPGPARQSHQPQEKEPTIE